MDGMEGKCFDFVEYLGADVSLHIFTTYLQDPKTLACASCVSHSWQKFVNEKGLAKKLCSKTFSGCFKIVGTIVNYRQKIWDDHVYAALLYAFQSSETFSISAIKNGIRASTTSDSNNQSITNTIFNPRGNGHAANGFWSSTGKGKSEAQVQETLTYKLRHGIWAIKEFRVRPCPAQGNPYVNSANSVRFSIGHLKPSIRKNEWDTVADNEVQWTYTSRQFSMLQEERLQSFRLPKPVLCLDGYLKIELLGRAQRHERDGLFYICVKHVQALGHCLTRAFDIRINNIGPLMIYVPKEMVELALPLPHFSIDIRQSDLDRRATLDVPTFMGTDSQKVILRSHIGKKVSETSVDIYYVDNYWRIANIDWFIFWRTRKIVAGDKLKFIPTSYGYWVERL